MSLEAKISSCSFMTTLFDSYIIHRLVTSSILFLSMEIILSNSSRTAFSQSFRSEALCSIISFFILDSPSNYNYKLKTFSLSTAISFSYFSFALLAASFSFSRRSLKLCSISTIFNKSREYLCLQLLI